jgi:hypothetical protein
MSISIKGNGVTWYSMTTDKPNNVIIQMSKLSDMTTFGTQGDQITGIAVDVRTSITELKDLATNYNSVINDSTAILPEVLLEATTAGFTINRMLP